MSVRLAVSALTLLSILTACKEERPAAPIAERYIKAIYAKDAATVNAVLCEGDQAQLTVERLQAQYAEPFESAILSQSKLIGQTNELYHDYEGWVMFDVEVPDLDTLWNGYQPTFHKEVLPDGSEAMVMDDPLPAGAARIAAGKLDQMQDRFAVHLRRDDARGWCVIDERTRLGLYERSRQLAAAGDYEGAIAKLEEVRALDPKAKLLDEQVAKLRKKADAAKVAPPSPTP